MLKSIETDEPINLRELEFFKFALDQHAIVSVSDFRGNITYVNDTFCEISGYGREELLGQNHRILKSDEHSPEFYDDLWSTISNGSTWQGELKNEKKGGGSYWVKATIVPYTSEKNKVIQYVSIRTDITYRKNAEIELRKLSRAVEQVPNSIFITNTEGTIEYVNSRFTVMTGYTADEAIGQNASIIKSDKTPQGTYTELWNTIQSGQEWRGEIQEQHKDGHCFWAQETIAPVKDTNGNITHYVATQEDITHRIEAEIVMRDAVASSEVANRAKTELMANMSHELRTPLNAIIGFTGAITAEIYGPMGNEKYQEYINDIGDAGQHLLELINDILDVSAIEAGKLELQEDGMAIDDLVEASVRLIANRAKQKQIHIHTDIQIGLPIFHADARRMKQILLNLLSNAVKFTPDDGTVTLSVSQANSDGHVFIITDTGIGMNNAELEKALTQFGQVDSGLTRKEEGTGLGLPLTKGLVELHGGVFDITSETGVGTTVTLTFPPERSVSDA